MQVFDLLARHAEPEPPRHRGRVPAFLVRVGEGQAAGQEVPLIIDVCLSPGSFQAKQSLATLTKDVPKRHSLAMPGETMLNGNQEWVVQADLPLTAAIRQSQQTLYHSHPPHPADRQGKSCPAAAVGCFLRGHLTPWGSSFFIHTIGDECLVGVARGHRLM